MGVKKKSQGKGNLKGTRTEMLSEPYTTSKRARPLLLSVRFRRSLQNVLVSPNLFVKISRIPTAISYALKQGSTTAVNVSEIFPFQWFNL